MVAFASWPTSRLYRTRLAMPPQPPAARRQSVACSTNAEADLMRGEARLAALRYCQAIGWPMPIRSRLPPDSAFDPKTIRILTAAFEEAWRAIDRTASVGPDADAARDKLARLIIASAQAGERNAVKLRNDAIAFFRLAHGDKRQ